MKIETQLPRLEGATEWFGGTQAHAESEATGHPTLVHFWSASCGICKDNLPRVGQWRDEKRELGLRVIGIHMPRYEADTDVETVRDLISKYEITEPVAVDNEHKLKDARSGRASDWIFVGGIIIGLAVLAVASATISIYLLYRLGELLAGR